jgi:DNA-binding PadR family transcriptional regulator
MEGKGWLESVWGYTEQNRQAKFYRLTSAGRKQLASELSRWKQYTGAVELVITAESGRAR